MTANGAVVATATPPITVYLDSSDYSRLSAPKKTDAVASVIRTRLTEWSRAGTVRFVYSGVHISEMAPLAETYTDPAAARVDLLVDLCERNAFISFDKLINAELGTIAAPDRPRPELISTEGDWFPNIEDILPPVNWASGIEEVTRLGKQRGLDRKARRKLERKLFKHQALKPATRAFLVKANANADHAELLASYPMRPEDADVLSQYILGKATTEEATSALMNSLRDPRWMMRWFATHHERLTPVIEWMRKPANDIAKSMKEVALRVVQMRNKYASSTRVGILEKFLSHDRWVEFQDEVLVNVVGKILSNFYPDCKVALTPQAIDAHCPGFATAIRSLHSSLWTAVGAQPRTPRDSDFLDSIHSMYAPYTTFFRTDRYMSTHIRKHALSYGTEVVSRLEDLVPQIEERLS